MYPWAETHKDLLSQFYLLAELLLENCQLKTKIVVLYFLVIVNPQYLNLKYFTKDCTFSMGIESTIYKRYVNILNIKIGRKGLYLHKLNYLWIAYIRFCLICTVLLLKYRKNFHWTDSYCLWLLLSLFNDLWLPSIFGYWAAGFWW